jgi:hypothetical protein
VGFAARDAQEATSRAEQFLKFAAPTIKLAESVTARGLFQNVLKVQAQLARAAVPQANLEQLIRAAVPQTNLWQSVMASGAFEDIIKMQAQLEAVAQTVRSDTISDTEFRTILSRDSQRLLFGEFVYCLVL